MGWCGDVAQVFQVDGCAIVCCQAHMSGKQLHFLLVPAILLIELRNAPVLHLLYLLHCHAHFSLLELHCTCSASMC
jgi:hypothetical protein